MLHFLHGNQYKNCTLILYNLNVKKNNYYFLLMCVVTVFALTHLPEAWEK